ncbi:unnamed protein product [Tetraodon nigroviridis]|uniref:(spotted green pufferfish) hypothetical protein n=1 Tax=Tetraodon nigroviridis TaxID=99883 RepID=Q4S615_TETNG|nr:unnamed protein product [Tetraodon nigroviridis]
MASMQDGLNFTAPPYGKVLLLGAIAAASAFVVTILIVVLCVGCQRQSKLRSISKSDADMNKLNCNGKSSFPRSPPGRGRTASTPTPRWASVRRRRAPMTPSTPWWAGPDRRTRQLLQRCPPTPRPRPTRTGTRRAGCRVGGPGDVSASPAGDGRVRLRQEAEEGAAEEGQRDGHGRAAGAPPEARPSLASGPAPAAPSQHELPRRNAEAFNVPAFPRVRGNTPGD